MILACIRCQSLFVPIGSPHPAPSLCPQCSAQKCSRCLTPGPTNAKGLCSFCATPHQCERCGAFDDGGDTKPTPEGWVCVDGDYCEEHRELWGEPGTSGEQYAGAVEP